MTSASYSAAARSDRKFLVRSITTARMRVILKLHIAAGLVAAGECGPVRVAARRLGSRLAVWSGNESDRQRPRRPGVFAGRARASTLAGVEAWRRPWGRPAAVDDRPRRDADRLATSDKEGAAGIFKGGFGFHSMLAYGDQTGEALAA